MQESSFSLDHPVVRCAGELNAALDRVEGVDPMYMPAPAKAAALVELTRISSRVQVLLGRVLASADDVALSDGARSAAAWRAHRTRTSYGTAATAGAACGVGRSAANGKIDAINHRLWHYRPLPRLQRIDAEVLTADYADCAD